MIIFLTFFSAFECQNLSIQLNIFINTSRKRFLKYSSAYCFFGEMFYTFNDNLILTIMANCSVRAGPLSLKELSAVDASKSPLAKSWVPRGKA